MTATILSIHANSCRACAGLMESNGRTCRECYGSGVRNVAAAMRENPAYGWGIRDHHRRHALDLTLADSPFLRGSFADTCWRAGWAEADRAEIALDRAEKVASEQLGPGDWLDRAGGIR
jgi:hypothetical protein